MKDIVTKEHHFSLARHKSRISPTIAWGILLMSCCYKTKGTWWRQQIWKHFLHYWPFEWGIHGSLVNSPHKGQWRGALIYSLICAWINRINNREAGDLRRHHAHYDITVMNNEPTSAEWASSRQLSKGQQIRLITQQYTTSQVCPSENQSALSASREGSK